MQFNHLIKEKNKFIAHNFSGKYLDCGTMNGYIKSTLEFLKYEIMYDRNWLCWFS
jgi:UTP-glucose-1-phosphate uridylyltransferase